MILLKGGLVLENGKLAARDVLIEGDRVIEVAGGINRSEARVIDIRGGWVIPGAVDVHVHLREPGFTHKETIKTGTAAAARGGVAAVMAMPNLNPVPDSVQTLKAEQDIIDRDAVVRVYPLASVTCGQRGAKLSDFDNLSKIVKAFSDDGKCVEDLELLKAAIKLAKKHNTIICSHAEASGCASEEQAEYQAVEREIAALKEAGGCKYHFCHLSTERAFSAVKKARKEGLDVSCEVTPHHLLLDESLAGEDANYKMNPPLRSKADKDATVAALLGGTAAIIATDHAPHTEAEKWLPYKDAPCGVIGLETFLPLIYTEFVKSGKASHADFLNWCVYNPARRFNLPHGEIKAGGLADIAVLDIGNKTVINPDGFASKSKNSAFIGAEIYGENMLTLVGGKAVYIR